MKIVRLLSVEKFRDLFVINEDTDAAIVKKCLYAAQSVKVHQYLGSELYNKIIDLVDSGNIAQPVNSKYKLLLDDHIQTVLGHWGYHKVIPHLNYQLGDKGHQQREGNHSKPTEKSVVDKMMSIASNDAEFTTDLMVKFICRHASDYPEYGRLDDGIAANKKPYFSGIQFGNSSNDRDPLEMP